MKSKETDARAYGQTKNKKQPRIKKFELEFPLEAVPSFRR